MANCRQLNEIVAKVQEVVPSERFEQFPSDTQGVWDIIDDVMYEFMPRKFYQDVWVAGMTDRDIDYVLGFFIVE